MATNFILARMKYFISVNKHVLFEVYIYLDHKKGGVPDHFTLQLKLNAFQKANKCHTNQDGTSRVGAPHQTKASSGQQQLNLDDRVLHLFCRRLAPL